MKEIVKFLILNKEKIYTIGELYSELDKNYPEYNLKGEDNLKYFKLAIYNIDDEYENIHKLLIKNVYNIIFSLKSKTDILNIYSKRVYSQNIKELDFNYIEIVELILKDKLSKERENFKIELREKEKIINDIKESNNKLQESYMCFHIMTSIVLFIFMIPYLFENTFVITLINAFQIMINLMLYDSRKEKSEIFLDKKYS